MKPQSEKIKESLQQTLDEAEWSWIKPHAQRGVVIVVSQELDLLSAAEQIATDQHRQIEKWISCGQLSKPSEIQMETWEQESGRNFLCVIVQPYVLIQERNLH